MQRHFDDQLKDLHQEILKMGVMTQEAIFRSIEALKAGDKAQAEDVIAHDKKIDSMENAIDEQCIDLIARNQPMAGDLRFIATALKINADLERIADLAVDICQRVVELVEKPLLKPLIDIPKLSAIAQKMVKDSIDAFVSRDSVLAKNVMLSDPEADQLRDRVQ
ncbi:MAG: phosphate signaling complex protein PhoU, partial [Candidatus Omnitrophica bacterium]|nr:phosphate signaling complex protein PhoU [Candidatus Omnitrophota bacterium]